MLALLLIAVQAAPSTAVQASPARPSRDVVVVGRRSDADTLADCIARRCLPDEEAAAALAVANAQYLTGDYAAARRTIGASLKRTRGRSRDFPGPVADLLTGAGKIDAHLGEFAAFEMETRRAYLIVREAYGPADPRAVARKLAMADAFLAVGQQRQGFATFAEAVDDADRAGDVEQRALVRVRHASAIVRASHEGGERQRVDRLLAPVLASRETALEGYRFAARAVVAKLAAREGDDKALAAVAATLPTGITAPLLVSARPVSLPKLSPQTTCEPNPDKGETGAGTSVAVLLGCGDVREQVPSQSFDRQWVDVDFVIGADGSVRTASVNRTSDRIDGVWTDEVLKTVRERRYAPGADRPDVARRERYTLTARYHQLSNSRIPVREALPVVEVVDITPGRAPYLATSR